MLKFHTKSDEELNNMSSEELKTYQDSLKPEGWVEYISWLDDAGMFTLTEEDCAEIVAYHCKISVETAMEAVEKVYKAHE